MKKLILTTLIVPLFFSCKKDEPTPVTPTPKTPTPVSSYFIKADVNSVLWEANDGQNGCRIASSTGKNINSQTSTLTVSYGAGFYQDALNGTITSPLNGSVDISYEGNYMTFAQYYDNDDAFRSTFTTGNQAFFNSTSPNTPGVEVVYFDNNQNEWHSSLGDQTGSTFNVTSNEAASDNIDGAYQKVKGTFTCKVYLYSDPTQSKTITTGSFYLAFLKD